MTSDEDLQRIYDRTIELRGKVTDAYGRMRASLVRWQGLSMVALADTHNVPAIIDSLKAAREASEDMLGMASALRAFADWCEPNVERIRDE